MSTNIWGSLVKDQDNPITIEEFIDQKIAEHNNEPDAHNLPGQSLDLHRKNDIIDHPAGSVKNDKYSFHTYDYNLHFVDYNYWTKSNFNLSGGEMKAYTVINSALLKSYIYRELPVTQQLGYANASFIFSIKFSIDLETFTGNYFYIGIGGASDLSSADYGFKFRSGKTYVTYHDSNTHSVEEVDISNTVFFDYNVHNIRIERVNSENIVNYYIDENLVYSCPWAGFASDSFLIALAHRNSTSSDSVYVDIFNPFLSVDYTY